MGNLMNEKQAAAVLNCSVSLLRKWRITSDGPDYTRLGRAVRYAEADLGRFIEAKRIRGRTSASINARRN